MASDYVVHVQGPLVTAAHAATAAGAAAAPLATTTAAEAAATDNKTKMQPTTEKNQSVLG